MPIFFKQSISQFENINGKKKESFEIIKGKDGTIHQIKGTTSNENKDTFNIQERVIKKNSNQKLIKNKYRTYKIKARDLNNIILESENSIINNNNQKIIKKNKKDTPKDKNSFNILNKKVSKKKVTKKIDKIDNKKKVFKKNTKKEISINEK